MTRLDQLPGRPLGDDLRVARTATRAQRTLGLARLDSMPAGSALEIPGCRSVHTFGMHFALDLIWLDASGRVVRVDREVGPRRLRTCLAARSVVETNAGEADRFIAAGV